MHAIIDVKKPAFFFIVGSVLLLLAVVVVKLNLISMHFGEPLMVLLLAPSLVAGKITVQQGIKEFTGEPLLIIEFTEYLKTVASLFFLFVVVPTALIFFRKKAKEYDIKQESVPVLLKMGYIVTFILFIVLPLLTITFSITSFTAFSTMKKQNVIQEYRANVWNDVARIATKAQEHFILPVEEGGGGKSFLKDGQPLILNDLGFEEKTVLGRFILYQQKSDTALFLHFIGNKKGTLTSGNHNPDITHVVEYEALIYPSSYRINTMN